MKTANKIISILTLFLIMIVSSCDMLQSTLSSEMNRELTAQTGSGSVIEKTFYYNGSRAADLLTTGDFKIDFGKKVVINKDGLVGKFLVTYTDGNSNISTVELKLGSNNELSLDCTELYLDMKPVLKYLKEKNVNNATVEISVSGLICNEGEQKGRNVSAFKETIKVQPLFKKLSDISVSTKDAPAGFTFEIPLNGKVVLAEDASLTVTGYDFEIVGLGTDGKSIVVKTNEDLTAQEFSSEITVTGITPISSGNGYSVDFVVLFAETISFPFTKTFVLPGYKDYTQILPASAFDGLEFTSIIVEITTTESGWASLSGANSWNSDTYWSECVNSTKNINTEVFIEAIRTNGLWLESDLTSATITVNLQ